MRIFAILLLAGVFVTNGRAECVKLESGNAQCVVETAGARIVSYSVDGHELLWMPETESGDSRNWRHGGMPIAWPWFGRIGVGDENIHGYAWKSDFSVASRTAGAVVLVLEVESAALEYAIRLDGALVLELRSKNKSKFDFPMGVAFHPYFRVGERDSTAIEGLTESPVPVTNSVDRSVRFGEALPRHECIVHDNARNLALRIVSEGATGLNLWNPGQEKRCPGIIPNEEWRRFVAVEPFAMGQNRFFVLSPGESHVLKMS
nr:hypothetical protein [Kiritimatiellia bacterium]